MKRIVIMADGKGMRWKNYMGIPKHFAQVKGEELIARTVRILHGEIPGVEIIVTSHDERYEFPGSRRYEPLNNIYEIDRFTRELITENMCFLYGDTFYTEEAIRKIIDEEPEDILFFGNETSIVAVKIRDAALFREQVEKVRRLYLNEKIRRCAGWEVYRLFTGQAMEGDVDLTDRFVFIDDETRDVDTPDDYEVMRK